MFKPLLGALLTSLLATAISAQGVPPPPVSVTLAASAPDPATGTIPFRATLMNRTDAALQDVELTVSGERPAEIVIDDPSWTCTPTPTFQMCRRATVGPQATVALDFVVRLPRRAGRAAILVYGAATLPSGRYVTGVAIVEAVIFRPFRVTSAADAGEGTLRAAIQALNADPECALVACRIEFALPAAAPGTWWTIMPESPLPTIVAADVEIDAALQPESNALGPEVALIGTSLAQGNGLYVRAARMAVRGLAIGGFPDSGILYFPTARGSVFIIERNYVGLDATGRHAIPNGARGVTIAEGIVRESHIRDNVVSGNFRSGIFLVTQEEPGLPTVPVLTIARNTITGNGASGIFVGPRAQQVRIVDNVIARNAHFGIALDRRASFISIGANTISGHPLPAIDLGLDGPDGVNVLESARYDPATNTTIVTGTGPVPTFAVNSYWFYANDTVDASGHAEAERFLGVVQPQSDGRFTFTVGQDLRGKYVNAQVNQILNLDGAIFTRAGELVRAIRVE